MGEDPSLRGYFGHLLSFRLNMGNAAKPSVHIFKTRSMRGSMHFTYQDSEWAKNCSHFYEYKYGAFDYKMNSFSKLPGVVKILDHIKHDQEQFVRNSTYKNNQIHYSNITFFFKQNNYFFGKIITEHNNYTGSTTSITDRRNFVDKIKLQQKTVKELDIYKWIRNRTERQNENNGRDNGRKDLDGDYCSKLMDSSHEFHTIHYIQIINQILNQNSQELT